MQLTAHTATVAVVASGVVVAVVVAVIEFFGCVRDCVCFYEHTDTHSILVTKE